MTIKGIKLASKSTTDRNMRLVALLAKRSTGRTQTMGFAFDQGNEPTGSLQLLVAL
jgi:hypothetical protein